MLRATSAWAHEDARLTTRIRELFPRRRGAFGSPRIWSDLVIDDGERIGRKRVEHVMRLAGLSASPSKKLRSTTIRVPGVRVAGDQLRSENFNYIEVFYNRDCRHRTLGQRSLAEYEKIHPNFVKEQDQAACTRSVH